MEAAREPPAELLLRRWALVAAAGALRSSAEETRRRRLPGSFGIFVQFNPSHRQSKRPADTALEVPETRATHAAPLRQAFNFTHAKPVEFLAGIAFGAAQVELRELEGDSVDDFRDQAASVVLANVSPLMHGHSLVLLDWASVNPQRLERDLLCRGIGVARAIDRDDFALGFNSAGAWSSVNHFHFQGFFFPPSGDADCRGARTNFPVTQQPRADWLRVGASVVIQRLPEWPMACYAVGLRHDGACDAAITPAEVSEVAGVVWGLIHILQRRGIPHNVLVTTSPRLLVWVFPRQPQRENGTQLFGASPGRLRVAIAEVAGLVVAGDDGVFRELTEASFTQILRDEVSISPVLAAEIEREWTAVVDAPSPDPRDC